MEDARRYEQENNDRIVDKMLQGLEFLEEMRDNKESCAALLISVHPKWLTGVSKWPTGSRMGFTLRLLGATNNFRKKGFLIGVLLL